MRVVALKAWSNGSVSMEERQIAELPDALAAQLIAQGIVAPTALPEITDADDGKVLTANSGEWVAANPSGGEFIVSFASNSNGATGDCTQGELADAVKAGKRIRLKVGGSDYRLIQCSFIFARSMGTYSFECTGYSHIFNTNSVTIEQYIATGRENISDTVTLTKSSKNVALES